jgi:hypothetical protein
MTSSALHAFLATPHPTMPSFILEPQETEDVVALLRASIDATPLIQVNAARP